jgi:flavodoxin
MTCRILVVYYSRGGATQRVAERLAGLLDADLDPIAESGSRRGVGGYLRSACEALAKGVPTIAVGKDPRDYDFVVLGTPVWVGTMASPVRAYLLAHAHHLPPLAFFAVMGGRGGEETVRELKSFCNAPRASFTIFSQRDVEHGRFVQRSDAFARALRSEATSLSARHSTAA